MPLLKRINISGDEVIALWQISESHAELHGLLRDDFQETHKEKRIQQANASHWLASRLLIQEVFPQHLLELKKDEWNKPSLLVNQEARFISITHSAHMAGIYISAHRPVGIDLEKIDARVNRVARKFMNEREWAFAGNEELITEKTLIWSAKETLYKLHGEKELDFKLHLLIEPFQIFENKGFFIGNICKTPPFKQQRITYEIIDSIVLTYTSNNE